MMADDVPQLGPELGDNAQLGDVQTGDAAGGDIYHGAQLAEVQAFVREYVWLLNEQIDVMRAEHQARMRAIEVELWALRLIIAAGIVAYILAGG